MPNKLTRVEYQRVNWKDTAKGATPLNAANLNKMDNGIVQVTSAVNRLDEEIEVVNTSLATSKVALDNKDIELNDRITQTNTETNGRIDVLATDISNKASTSSVNTLQTNVSNLSKSLDNASSKIDQNSKDIKNLTAQINNLSPDIDGGEIA
jgi:exonuclease VII large subunit